MKKILTKKGFTLIELIVVIAILAILAAILIPSLTNYLNAAAVSRDQTNARSQYSAAVLDLATDGTIDGTYTDCTPTVVDGVITEFSCAYDSGTYLLSTNFQ